MILFLEQVYTAETGAVASKIASWASYQGSAALAAYTFTSTPAYSWKKVSNNCYCATPPTNCGAGYANGTCIVDESTSGLLTSSGARSGIVSTELGDFSNTGEWMLGGIIVASILIGSIGIVYFIVMA